MSISPIFTFAPVPLTNERSPLAHAAALIRKRLADNPVVAQPRHRISPPALKKAAQPISVESDLMLSTPTAAD